MSRAWNTYWFLFIFYHKTRQQHCHYKKHLKPLQKTSETFCLIFLSLLGNIFMSDPVSGDAEHLLELVERDSLCSSAFRQSALFIAQ